MKSGKEILAEFQLDPWMLYDTIVNSTDDYIYLVNMQEDRALISENMLQDFDLPDLIVPGPVSYTHLDVYKRHQLQRKAAGKIVPS